MPSFNKSDEQDYGEDFESVYLIIKGFSKSKLRKINLVVSKIT
jgi:hypothetical protein